MTSGNETRRTPDYCFSVRTTITCFLQIVAGACTSALPGRWLILAGWRMVLCSVTGKRAEGSFIKDFDDGTESLWTTRARSGLEGCLRLLIIWVNSKRVQKTYSNRPVQLAAFRKEKSKALIKAKNNWLGNSRSYQ